jgi:hypothetical protein
MSKEYQYIKNIRSENIANIVIVFSICLIPLLFTQILELRGKNMLGFPPKGFYMVMFGAASLLAILVSIVEYIRKVGIRVSVEGDAIIYKDRRKEKKILFNTISHLKFYLVSSGIKIVSENNTIQLFMGLQNISDFLQELKNAIDQKELSINYDRKKFFSFFKGAVYLDQRWARMYSISWKFIVIIILSSIITEAVCAISSRLSSSGVIFWWILLSIVWPYICYSYAENIFRRRLVKQIDEQSLTYPPRDIAYEKALYRKVLIFGALIYIVISIVAALFSIIIKK